MKKLIAVLLLAGLNNYAQLSMDSLRSIVQPYRLGYSTYFSGFVEKKGYGGPYILTIDGGGAAYGNTELYKFDKTGKESWKRTIKPQFSEIEPQSVAEDTKGNLYAFMLSYNPAKYRGGSERVVCFDKKGKLLWDKTLGSYTQLNNPVVSYIRQEPDGKIYMRGHVAKETEANGDAKSRYWEGWLDVTGKLTQKTGDVIDWVKDDWQKRYKPE
jgi:hypothetical protein